MMTINRTLFALLTVCAIAFAQSAVAQDKAPPDTVGKKVPTSDLVKPVDSNTPPTISKINNAPTADKKTKNCKYPALVC
ncbi:hypothetical protein MCEORH2_01174 [Methylophilaceae bacterium]